MKLFPPAFYELSVDSFREYATYLELLQSKFVGLAHFCFDLNAYPEELGDLSAQQRLFIYTQIKGGLPPENLQEIRTVHGYTREKFQEKEDQSQLERHMNLPAGSIEFYRKHDVTMGKNYLLKTTLDLLSLDFLTMVDRNFKIKKCKLCKEFFLIKTKRTPDYCTNRRDGSNQTCQQINASKNFQQKNKDNKPFQIYHKYYKRYHERTKVNTLKREVFEKWSREAGVKRDACIDGNGSVEDFEDWCHDSFPNRERKKK
ncbi:MAG: DUF6076 domain-containing protein [Eubacteriales bacterium]